MIVKGERPSALTSSGVQVTGQDASLVIKRVIERAAKRQEEGELRLRMEAERHAYGLVEEIWVFCKSHPQPDGTLMWSAETVDQVPGLEAHARTDRYEATPKRALTELRFKIAKLWAGKKVCASLDEARERAAKCVFQQTLISASDQAASE